MRYLVVLLSLILTSQIIYSQDEVKQNETDMEKIEILGLRTTVYMVGNLEMAKEWYSKAFGVEPYFVEPFYIGFNIGGYELGLLPEDNPTSYKAEGVIAYWGVEDIEKVYNHMLNTGAKEYEKPNNVGSDLMVAALKDPWGNVVGLIYNPHFKLPE